MSESTNPYRAPASHIAGSLTGEYRPATMLVGVVTLLLFGAAGTGALSAVAVIVAPVIDPTYHEPQGLSVGILLVGGLALLEFVAFVASVITFLIWVHRANSNARALGAVDMEYSPGWAVGWWFMPVFNLFKPYKVVCEIHQASSPDEGNDTWLASPVPTFIGHWWGVWILGNVVGQVELRVSDADHALVAGLGLFSAVVSLVAAVLATKVVRSIQQRQEARAERIARGPAEQTEFGAGPKPPLLADSY